MSHYGIDKISPPIVPPEEPVDVRTRPIDIKVSGVVGDEQELLHRVAEIMRGTMGTLPTPMPRTITGSATEPKEPLMMLRREGDAGPFCPECGSSLVRRWLFFRGDNCINPECRNRDYTARIGERG